MSALINRHVHGGGGGAQQPGPGVRPPGPGQEDPGEEAAADGPQPGPSPQHAQQ